MKRLAVIGDPDFNLGFRLAGVRDIFDVTSDDELISVVEKVLESDEIGVAVIKYEFLKKLPLALKRAVDESVEPTFVAVGEEGGVEEIREKIRKAIGVDLWK
ncbi:Archaeal/vacuolar-type H+-ATPase subunit F [Geoglobus ahangari]|uniref:A-type ATP synthase subunit F n=1 Tax=Geoglobus ahangari TaxID=113653 RepID=A0A0F7IIG5_9EURY|nr:V-type ATP synthase subunit F [Geoglobus ahangari]AKG91769.1 Archaeal/vacuolar-type H+-ATPase subunit F [Geoglobus ahangari]